MALPPALLSAARARGPVAVLHQARPPPVVDGVVKPPKPGGYADSSADVAAALAAVGVPVVTPGGGAPAADAPDAAWSWPDTDAGIAAAAAAGAAALWANTTLGADHPCGLVAAAATGRAHPHPLLPPPVAWVVGQPGAAVQAWEDKGWANATLAAAGLPALAHARVGSVAGALAAVLRGGAGGAVDSLGAPLHAPLGFPAVVKPVRGRGSEGVTRVRTEAELAAAVTALLSATLQLPDGATCPRYGASLLVEPFLGGDELTVTVLPPGAYWLPPDGVAWLRRRGFAVVEGGAGGAVALHRHWALPPVRRHLAAADGGVAPYNGAVPVSTNTTPLPPAEVAASPAVASVLAACEAAASTVGATAPIRVDVRRQAPAAGGGSGGAGGESAAAAAAAASVPSQAAAGADDDADTQAQRRAYRLFDVNLKPNMTGPGRHDGRAGAAGLTTLAAAAAPVGWSFGALCAHLLANAVPVPARAASGGGVALAAE